MKINCQTNAVKQMVFFDNMIMRICLPRGIKQLGPLAAWGFIWVAFSHCTFLANVNWTFYSARAAQKIGLNKRRCINILSFVMHCSASAKVLKFALRHHLPWHLATISFHCTTLLAVAGMRDVAFISFASWVLLDISLAFAQKNLSCECLFHSVLVKHQGGVLISA